MKHITTLLLALFGVLPLAAQSEGPSGGDLFFPPKLTIGISNDASLWSRLYGGEVEPPEQKSELVLQKTVHSNNTYLPLPIIFFDPASSVLPERYQQFTSSFDADSYTEEQEIDMTYNVSEETKYPEILNIIGYRLGTSDTISIALQGGYSTEAGENAEIGAERADVINEYLQRIWRIDSSRITLLPPRRFADSTDHALAQEEARSVRIYPESWELLRTVHYTTSQISMSGINLNIGLAPNVSRSDIASARLVIASGDDILGETLLPIPEGDEFAPMSWTGMWFLPRRINAVEEPLSINLLLVTTSGEIRPSNTVTIPIRIEEPEEHNPDEIMTAEVSEDAISEEYYDEYDMEEAPREYDGPESDAWVKHYHGEIYYFDARDTTLGRLQQMYTDARIRQLKEELAQDTTVEWRLEVTASGDATEDPEINQTYLQTGRSFYQMSTGYFMELLDDPDFKLSLYIMPEMIDTENFDQQGMVNDLIEQMYGERAEEIKRLQEDSRSMYISDPDETGIDKERITPLLLSRAAAVADYVVARIDTGRMDSIVLKTDGDYQLRSVQWLPEERFAYRLATLRIYTSNDWEWEEEEMVTEEYLDAETYLIEDSDESEAVPEEAEEVIEEIENE